jgi:hypothetical protein
VAEMPLQAERVSATQERLFCMSYLLISVP